jgi:hypothetical protein
MKAVRFFESLINFTRLQSITSTKTAVSIVPAQTVSTVAYFFTVP